MCKISLFGSIKIYRKVGISWKEGKSKNLETEEDMRNREMFNKIENCKGKGSIQWEIEWNQWNILEEKRAIISQRQRNTGKIEIEFGK